MMTSPSSPEDERNSWQQPEPPAAPEPLRQSEPSPASDWQLPPAQAAPSDGAFVHHGDPLPLYLPPAPDASQPNAPDPHITADPYSPYEPYAGYEPAPSEPTAAYEPIEPPRFELFEPPPRPPERIPNFGHLCLLCLLLAISLLCTGLLLQLALHDNLFGVSTRQRAITDIHYTLGSEALLYVLTLLASLVVFPLVWHKNFFAGVQWNAATAFRLRWQLVSAAGACFVLAFIDSAVAPGPANAPIDKMFRAPGAAWLLFAFGVTFAPFFEETFFRGFLLPALCTAYDWFGERYKHRPRLPLTDNGHPQWTVPAMIVGSIATSLPFAALHAQQTGYSWGPFVLLVGVSIVLCAVRLSTRSLASSVLVHASYNFMLFTIMLVGTHGFRHLGKM